MTERQPRSAIRALQRTGQLRCTTEAGIFFGSVLLKLPAHGWAFWWVWLKILAVCGTVPLDVMEGGGGTKNT